MTRLTIKALQKQRDDGVKIAVLTCYDASFAALLDAAGLDSLARRRLARHGAAGARHHRCR